MRIEQIALPAVRLLANRPRLAHALFRLTQDESPFDPDYYVDPYRALEAVRRKFRRRHTVGQQAQIAHRHPMLDRVMRAPGEFASRSITVRQRKCFQDFHDLLVRLQLVPSGRLAMSGDTSRTGRNTTGADARRGKDFQRGQNH